jgi:signal transduction histidine kinase
MIKYHGKRLEPAEARPDLLTEVLEASLAGFAILRGHDFVYELVNPAYQAIAPRRKFLGRTVAECWPDLVHQVTPLLGKVIETGEPFHANDMRFEIEREQPGRLDEVYFSFTYQPLPVDSQGEPGILVTVIETTATKKAEAERSAMQARLATTARLAAMGTLVAGVAHEINNPLAGEMASQAMALREAETFAERLREGGPLDREALVRRLADVIEMLRDAQSGAKRIARIVKDLSVLGRPDRHRSPVDLASVVESALRRLPASVWTAATIRVAPGEGPKVAASTGHLEQVVVDLVTNASLARAPSRPGEITLQIGRGDHDTARLDVTDNGTGIDPAILDRIFDPFFTTRDVGEGMGLGLHMCHAIVTAHGGTLTVTSEVGKGSTFRVELPAAPPEA